MGYKLYTGSVDLSKLLEAAKKSHSAFMRSDKTKKVYGNIAIWVRDDNESDQYGNHVSIQLNSKEEAQASEDKVYFANAKLMKKQDAAPIVVAAGEMDDDDLPF